MHSCRYQLTRALVVAVQHAWRLRNVQREVRRRGAARHARESAVRAEQEQFNALRQRYGWVVVVHTRKCMGVCSEEEGEGDGSPCMAVAAVASS
jgi:hypothetical protein